MDKMKMETVDGIARNVEKLEELFPNCVTETRGADGSLKKAINFDVLRQILSGEIADDPEAYDFTWVGKKAALAEAYKPIRKTLRPCPEESRDWDSTQNLYIEGDNLEVLKLLQESYLGKVKAIYIDPPYNTGNDFIYNDNFRADDEEYDEDADLYDEDGNSLFKENNATNPRFHSAWCSMIYSRLLLARTLLSDDGVIFISIDDNEVENLKKICTQVFGGQNFIASLVWDLGTGTSAGHFTRGHEYILCFAKNKDILPNFRNNKEGERIVHGALKKISYKNPAVTITFPQGFEFEGNEAVFKGEIGDSEKEYILSEEMRFKDGKLVSPATIKAGFATRNQIEDFILGKEVFDSKGQKIVRFYFNSRGILFYEKEKTIINPKTVLSNIASTKNGTTNLEALLNAKLFDFPKPVELIKYLIGLVANEESIVLDFFSGSSTSAQAVMQLNAERFANDVIENKSLGLRYMMVQLPEVCDAKSEAYKSGYKNICEIGKERIRRAGDKIKSENPLTTEGLDFGFRVFKVDSSNMNDVYYGCDDLTQDLIASTESNIKPDRSDLDLFFSCVLEWGLPLSLPYRTEQIAGFTVHVYNDGDLLACFEEGITEKAIIEIAKRNPFRVVFRDSCFENLTSKINLGEIFKRFAPDTKIKTL